jgi:magnesium transporter
MEVEAKPRGEDEPTADEETLARVEALCEARDVEPLRALIQEYAADDRAWMLAHLDAETRSTMAELLGPEMVSELLDDIAEPQARELLHTLPPAAAAAAIEAHPSYDAASLLRLLSKEEAAELLGHMTHDVADDVREVLSYPEDSAGGIMDTELMRFPQTSTVRQAIHDLRVGAEAYSDYAVQYAYVVDVGERLVGVVRLRDLVFARADQSLQEIMIPEPQYVGATDTLAELREFFEDYDFLGAPVVDAKGRLLGVVRRFAVEEALRRQMNVLVRKLSGIVGGDEMRSMPLWQRSARRLSWLTLNIGLNVLAASVIAANQDTLEAAIVLAVFLPMISDMSGCSGNQAVAVSLRELALGLVRPTEIMRVLGKELGVGVINGVVLGALLGAGAALWKGNVWLGLVVGGALAINTVVAVLLGGLVPLLLRRMRTDPALASGPLLTTVTDMCGFFFVLTIASSVLDRLPG